MFCKYKNIFGEPGKGVHSYRLFNIAIVDVVLTLLIAIIITRYVEINYIYAIIGLIITGILIHRLFCVNTTINKIIFGPV